MSMRNAIWMGLLALFVSLLLLPVRAPAQPRVDDGEYVEPDGEEDMMPDIDKEAVPDTDFDFDSPKGPYKGPTEKSRYVPFPGIENVPKPKTCN